MHSARHAIKVSVKASRYALLGKGVKPAIIIIVYSNV
jgi:hypothetical protein